MGLSKNFVSKVSRDCGADEQDGVDLNRADCKLEERSAEGVVVAWMEDCHCRLRKARIGMFSDMMVLAQTMLINDFDI